MMDQLRDPRHAERAHRGCAGVTSWLRADDKVLNRQPTQLVSKATLIAEMQQTARDAFIGGSAHLTEH
jgi:hypothetical protein